MIPWGLPDFVPMDRFPRGRADFVAHVSVRGWWDWEDPLPVAFAALAPLFPGAFWDVGANTGFYAILMARLDPQRPVRAFEPYPPVAEVLEANLGLAGVDNVAVERVAVADRDGTSLLHVPPLEQDMIETRTSLHPMPGARVSLPVAQARLDSLHDGQPVGLVKIDVEGAEPAVLAGAGAVLRQQRPLVSVEVLDTADVAALNALVQQSDYAGLALRPGLQVTPAPSLTALDGAPNHLLVPSERLGECQEVLAGAAAQLSDHRAALAGPDPEGYLARTAAILPQTVLTAQLAVDRRLLERERAHVDRLAVEVSVLRG